MAASLAEAAAAAKISRSNTPPLIKAVSWAPTAPTPPIALPPSSPPRSRAGSS